METLQLLAKNALSNAQKNAIFTCISHPKHKGESALLDDWPSTDNGMYALVLNDVPIGLLDLSGGHSVSPAWWIDSLYCGKGYGSNMLPLIVTNLKSRQVQQLGRMPIQTLHGQYDDASSYLAKKLRLLFEQVD